MSKTFGREFILINDVIQPFPKGTFAGDKWVHLATIVRGLKEYCCFKDSKTNKIYIEEVDDSLPHYFKQINDDLEFKELSSFLIERGVLSLGVNQEFKIAKHKK